MVAITCIWGGGGKIKWQNEKPPMAMDKRERVSERVNEPIQRLSWQLPAQNRHKQRLEVGYHVMNVVLGHVGT